MSTKSGWWYDKNDVEAARQDMLDDAPPVHAMAEYVRVTVSVWPCPETIKRSELPGVLKRGWEVQTVLGDAMFCGQMPTDKEHCFLVGFNQCYEMELDAITHIRCPGDSERPWTKVVDE